MPIVWSDACKIGHAKVDSERRKIFDMANEFVAAQDVPSARVVLTALTAYGVNVFPLEEALIRQCKPADFFRDHAIHHRVLSNYVTRLVLDKVSLPSSPYEDIFIRKTAGIVEMWVLDHFIAEDPKIREDLLKAAAAIHVRRTAD